MYNKIRKLQDIKVKDKTVIVRVNYDILLNTDDEVLDNTYITASLETIQYLIEQNCKVVLISHLGNPGGQIHDTLSLMPARFELGKLLNKTIKFAHIQACENSIKFMEQGEVLMLENLKFDPRESSDKPKERTEFMEVLAGLCDIYVNEAFGVHEELASMIELPQMIKSVAGFNFIKEIEALDNYKSNKKSKSIFVLGGGPGKLEALDVHNILPLVDTVLVGGAIGLDFLAASDVKTGAYQSSPKIIKKIKQFIREAKKQKVTVIMPVDHLVSKTFSEDALTTEIDTQQIPDKMYAIDIGSKTLELFREQIESAQTILWNGPLGVFEWECANRGTEAIGEMIGLSASKDAIKIAGGAHTLYAMKLLRIKSKRFTHTSIGGNMMLSYLSQTSFSVINVLLGKQSL